MVDKHACVSDNFYEQLTCKHIYKYSQAFTDVWQKCEYTQLNAVKLLSKSNSPLSITGFNC